MLEQMNMNLVASAIVDYLGQALIFGTAVALLTWLLLATALRRMRPSLQVAFWLVVLIKFVVPVGPGWQYSLSSLMGAVAPVAASPAAVVAAQPGTSAAPAALEGEWLPVTAPLTTQAPAAAARLSGWSALVLTYSLLALFFAAWRIVAYRRFVSRTRALPRADEATRAIVLAVARRVGVSAPEARISEDAPAPYVFGLLRPTLVLSRRQLADATELEAVILHELAHVRRGDLWVRVLQSIVGAVLFFWPIVGWVNRRIDLARESACDEWALRHGSLSPGQYARLLLRCSRTRQSRWSHTPAAMASNITHVERRIEMIMDTPNQRRSRMLGFLAGASLLGWAGFALTGASAAALQEGAPAPAPAAAAPVAIFVKAGDDATAPPDILFAPNFSGAPGAVQFFNASDADGHMAAFHIALNTNDKPEALAAFLADHPAADTNADGAVTRVERDAYVSAVAMSDSAAVLAKFPKADRNGSATLEADEAVRLVALGMLPDISEMKKEEGGRRMVVRTLGDETSLPEELREKIAAMKAKAASGDAGEEDVVVSTDGAHKTVTITRAAPGASGEAQTMIMQQAGGDGACQFKVIRGEDGAFTTEDGQKIAMRTAEAMAPGMGESPAAWIVENIQAEPASAEVARYVALVEAAPLAHFLELNPESDINGDGTLTAAERDAFVERHSTKMRERVLEKHPEADANGDGLLTNEEMQGFFRNHGPKQVWTEKLPDGSTARVMIRSNGADIVEAEAEVETAEDK